MTTTTKQNRLLAASASEEHAVYSRTVRTLAEPATNAEAKERRKLMNNNRCLPILVVTVIGTLALAAAKPAFGADIYNANGFEQPPFVAGQHLVGQDGWVGVPVLSLEAAVVSTDLAYQGQQSVEVQGANLVHQDFINELTHGYYDAIGSYRRPVNYQAGPPGIPIVRIQAAVRIDGPPSPGSNFFSASIAAIASRDGVRDGVGELAISSDGHVYGYCGCDLVPTFQASDPITLNAWHILAIHLNFAARTYMFSVDGTPLPGGPFPFPSDVNAANILVRGSLIAYAAPDTDTLKKNNYMAHYDNFSITTQ